MQLQLANPVVDIEEIIGEYARLRTVHAVINSDRDLDLSYFFSNQLVDQYIDVSYTIDGLAALVSVIKKLNLTQLIPATQDEEPPKIKVSRQRCAFYLPQRFPS